MRVQVEFAVKSNDSDQTESLVKKALSSFPVSFKFGGDSLLVQSQDQSPSLMLKSLRATGLIAIIRGLSSAATRSSTPYTAAASGVCIFEAFKGSGGWAHERNKGVARLAQLDNDQVFIDINASDLLPLMEYSVEVRECGDISDLVSSTGDIYHKISNATSDDNGRLEFVTEIKNAHIPDLIGRSLVLSPQNKDKNHYVAGIIARSAGVFENQKMVCACSGKTLWDEASKL
jgi:copper chaperone for superoxide dismutase